MTQKNLAYDHPAYLVRQMAPMGQNVAAASPVNKFVAFTSMQMFGVAAALITAGTSTVTAFNGTGTHVAINGDSFNVVHVFAGNGVAASTATHGPFSLSFGSGTGTMTAGVWTSVPLSGAGVTGAVQAGTNTSTGGVTLNQGDQVSIVRGADATAVSMYNIEVGILPLANVTA